jgi:hypothetical protein
MLTWDESITRISQAQGSPNLRSGFRWPWISRLPVIVTGSSGCGKTELWRRLTLKDKADELSEGPDDGFYFRQEKRSTLAMTTIPGQLSDVRTILNDKFFISRRKVNGVIFVASYGYNFVWPSQVESVTTTLHPFSLESLRDRNSVEEQQTFDETCRFITEKWSRSPAANRPRWLLVLCNKVDLYWPETAAAYDNYRLGTSDFGRAAEALVSRLAGGGFRYHVLPTALQPRNYLFDSTQGTLKTESGLSNEQCDASLKLLVDTLEELSGA